METVAQLSALTEKIRVAPFATTSEVCDWLTSRKAAAGVDWPEAVGAIRASPLHSVFLEDPHTARAWLKPRGYPGDAVMMDHVYMHPSVAHCLLSASELGRQIYRFTAGCAFPSRAVRWRRERAAREIETLAAERGNIRVFAFACGHLREFSLIPLRLRDKISIVAADSDPESLAEVEGSCGAAGHVTCLRLSAGELISPKRKDLGAFDLVYTLGLLDYMPDRTAHRIVRCLWDLVRPTGRLLAANFTTATRDTAYLEAFMDWWLLYRTVEDIAGWSSGLNGLKASQVFSDPWNQIGYFLAERS